MTAKHTPGPLTYAPTVGGYGIYRADNWPIAVAVQRDDNPVRGGFIADSEAKANAMLFAASPDLLALARQYAEECSECGGTATVWTNPPDPQDAKDSPCPDCADIWAVIDKAEGRA
jgi:hypothetical protein